MADNAQHNGADPVDVHVGARMRVARKLAGMSQQALAADLGVTFQQVQKYERGANRVSASMLTRAARSLRQPIGWFFDGSPTADEDPEDAAIRLFVNSPEGREWVAWGRRLDHTQRVAVCELLSRFPGKET